MAERKCNLVIDSCCDLPYELVQKMNVGTLYFPFEMSDGTHLDDFWQSMTAEEFYGLMRSDAERPTTAQIPITVIREKLIEIAKSGVPTVMCCFTAALSGTFDTIVNEIEDIRKKYTSIEIYAIDCCLASVAEGFLVVECVRQLDAGLTAAELAAWIEEARYFVNAYFTVDDLKYLKRGGRIPAIVASAGSKLDIKPILTFSLDGHLEIHSMVRGRKKAIRTIAKLMNETIIEPSRGKIVVSNADCKEDMDTLMSLYTGEPTEFLECSVGPVIGSHVGPGMLAASFWGPDRRKGAIEGTMPPFAPSEK